MLIRVILGSYLLFGLALIAILWGNPLLSRNVGIAIAGCIVLGWVVSAYFFFRHLRLPVRVKIIGWVFIVDSVGCTIAGRLSSYYFLHESWLLVFTWDVVGLALIATSLGLAIFLLRKFPALPLPICTPYTVESEAPDHVLRVGRTPN